MIKKIILTFFVILSLISAMLIFCLPTFALEDGYILVTDSLNGSTFGTNGFNMLYMDRPQELSAALVEFAENGSNFSQSNEIDIIRIGELRVYIRNDSGSYGGSEWGIYVQYSAFSIDNLYHNWESDNNGWYPSEVDYFNQTDFTQFYGQEVYVNPILSFATNNFLYYQFSNSNYVSININAENIVRTTELPVVGDIGDKITIQFVTMDPKYSVFAPTVTFDNPDTEYTLTYEPYLPELGEGTGAVNLTFVLIESTVNFTISAQMNASYYSGRNEGYDLGKQDGYTEGQDDGFRDGKEAGIIIGRNESYNEGYDEGKQDGLDEGFDNGVQYAKDNYNYVTPEEMGAIIAVAKNEGKIEGQKIGEEIGYQRGKEEGIDGGYQEGYREGYKEGSDNSFMNDIFGFLVPGSGHTTIIEALNAPLFSFEVPNWLGIGTRTVNIGAATIFSVIVSLSLLLWFMKILKG